MKRISIENEKIISYYFIIDKNFINWSKLILFLFLIENCLFLLTFMVLELDIFSFIRRFAPSHLIQHPVIKTLSNSVVKLA